jgi:hypothetical protein
MSFLHRTGAEPSITKQKTLVFRCGGNLLDIPRWGQATKKRNISEAVVA